MGFKIYCVYCSLFCVTLISSCFLFVVATENTKYVADADNSAATADDSVIDVTATTTADDFTLNSVGSHEKILPNYKKVKKLTDNNEVNTEQHNRPSSLLPLQFNNNDTFSDATSEASTEDTVELLQAARSTSTTGFGSKQPEQEVLPQFRHVGRQGFLKEESLELAADDSEHVKENKKRNFLPGMTEIPTVTRAVHEFADLPKEVLEVARSGVEALIFDSSVESPSNPAEHRKNNTLEILLPTQNSEEMQKDDQIIKINDSGGDPIIPKPATTTQIPDQNVAENIPNEQSAGAKHLPDSASANSNSNATTTHPEQQQQISEATSAPAPTGDSANAEEVPIPVFSEWAQKQMEAAEKQQQLEQDVANSSTQRKNNNNNTNGSHKSPPLKLRSKNYASPDCGAKIIASNGDASNTGAVLSASKDEYMLSPCTNRIWFVVELCEAIQAQKIDLANFELFSSSPRNFTVAVSNRFPTRDWSNVGRFLAEDSRTVQSFDLHPHLFGKFVRVDIHTHYSKEHFCPVSLFRVFGTSEFEAFETENHPNEDLDDFEDEFVLEQAHAKNSENNLFKSASDAVFSIVKKAAEVLAKPATNNNSEPAAVHLPNDCQTPAVGPFSCAECNQALVERVNEVLSCKTRTLSDLLHVKRLRRDLQNTPMCANNFGIRAKSLLNGASNHSGKQSSYFLHLLPMGYVGALCRLLAENRQNQLAAATISSTQSDGHDEDGAELALNLTIDQKLSLADTAFDRDMDNVGNQKKRLITADEDEEFKVAAQHPGKHRHDPVDISEQQQATVTAPTLTPAEQLARPQLELEMPATATPAGMTTTTGTATESVAETQRDDAVARDVNIFNLNNEDDVLTATPPTTTTTSQPEMAKNTNGVQQQPLFEGSADFSHSSITSSEPLSASATAGSTSSEDPSSWDSIDNLLTSTTMMPPGVGVATAAGGSGASSQQAATSGGSATTGGVGVGVGVGVGINMQQKIPNGGPHSESIFIRLSNRIKALERNMSLSGQYLEELSRRYKKQVEELQQTLTQQTLNVRSLEEQNRRHSDYEQLLSQHNLQLRNELEDLTLQVHACIVVIIFVGAFVVLVVMVGILFIRSMRRETQKLVELQRVSSKRKTPTTDTAAIQRKLNRRKSFEDFSDHQQSIHKEASSEKCRRPSEEATLILKECSVDASGGDGIRKQDYVCDSGHDGQPRQRKISVCYGNNNNNDDCMNSSGLASNAKRNGVKYSWPNSEQSKQHSRHQLEQQLSSMQEYDPFSETESEKRDFGLDFQKSKSSQLQNGSSGSNDLSNAGQKNKSSKRRMQNVKRQISAPTSSRRVYSTIQLHDSSDPSNSPLILNNNSDFDENLILDEDDLDNFLPVADLAYNEFMPDGPSGYQIQISTAPTATTPASATNNQSKADNKAAKKSSRRLSSPAFFKSPFTKSLKLKPTSNGPSTTPSHQSTSWEWYRSKKSDKHSPTTQTTTTPSTTAAANHLLRPSASDSFYQRSSPAVSLDSSSLSDINFLTNANENSFRILEEDILSSTSGGAAHTSNTTNGNGNGGSSSSGGNSSIRSASTSSSSKKKKNRSFNKIFKKVF